jgi:enamine deaminase RidA (YjgF/YER057c/UK114 family)
VVSIKGSQPDSAESRLQNLGIQLPAPPTPFGTYVETVQTGSLLFFSGMLPVVDHKPKYIGRVGKELDTEAGRDAAYTAALGVLAAAKQHLGSLDRVTRVVRLGVFIATSEDYVDHPRVADAVSGHRWRGQPSPRSTHRTRRHLRGHGLGKSPTSKRRQRLNKLCLAL